MQTRVYSNPHKGTWTRTNVNEYSLMPSFHHSVAVLPLPFLRSVLPFRCTIAVLLFRSYRCRCGWEWKCWKRLSVYIGMKRPERWLVVRLRQNGKNRIRTEWWLWCNGRWQWQWRNGIFHVGNGRMATEWWKPGNKLGHQICPRKWEAGATNAVTDAKTTMLKQWKCTSF